jgi:hypothetical protein
VSSTEIGSAAGAAPSGWTVIELPAAASGRRVRWKRSLVHAVQIRVWRGQRCLLSWSRPRACSVSCRRPIPLSRCLWLAHSTLESGRLNWRLDLKIWLCWLSVKELETICGISLVPAMGSVGGAGRHFKYAFVRLSTRLEGAMCRVLPLGKLLLKGMSVMRVWHPEEDGCLPSMRC